MISEPVSKIYVTVGFSKVINLAVLVHVGKGSSRVARQERCCHVG
jgi:hypothetical protein